MKCCALRSEFYYRVDEGYKRSRRGAPYQPLSRTVEKDVAPRQGTIGDPESTMFVRNYEITLNKEIILEIVGDKGVRINFLAPMGIW